MARRLLDEQGSECLQDNSVVEPRGSASAAVQTKCCATCNYVIAYCYNQLRLQRAGYDYACFGHHSSDATIAAAVVHFGSL